MAWLIFDVGQSRAHSMEKLYREVSHALDIEGAAKKPEIVEVLLQRVKARSDVSGVVAVLNSVISGSDSMQRDELVCGLLPSIQITLASAVSDLESYAQLRSHIYPVLDARLRSVWRRWEEQLPFDAASLLPK